MTKQFYLDHSDTINAIGRSCVITRSGDDSCENNCPLYAACKYRIFNDDSDFERCEREE